MWWYVVVAVVSLIVLIWSALGQRPPSARDKGAVERGRYNPRRKG